MNKIREAFIDIKIEVIKSIILHVFLDTAIALLAFNFLLSPSIGSMLFFIVIIISGIIGSLDFRFRYRRFSLRQFESYNPQLSEILRTSHDNADKENNPIVRDLVKETLYKLESASTYKLIGHKRVVLKVFILGILSVSSLGISIANISLDISNTGGGGTGLIKIGNVEIHTDEDIYGEKENINLGDNELKILLNPSSIISFNDIKEDIEEREFRIENFPVETSAQSEVTNEEELPKDFELIKNYNLRVRNL